MIPVRPLAHRSPFTLAAAALALATALAAAPAPARAKSSAPPHVKLDVVKYTLPNGLDVILCENHRLPTVGVNVWYHVGPANEEPGRTGFAHLFEHMMFKGSRHVPDGKHWTYLQTAGATMVNGTTEFDRTNYLEDLPSNQLETALWLESDRMGFLLDGLDAIKLANQQDVVRNERRQSTENVEYGVVEEELYHQLFPKTHPYYADVIGSHEDIQSAKLDDVRGFFKRYYCPNNASLAIVGDIDVAKTKALVAKYFGSIPRGADVPPIRVVTPPITSERRAVVTDNVSLPRIYIGWITPKAFTPGDAEGAIVSDILTGNFLGYGRGSSKASRLYKKLVYELRIAQDVTSSYDALQLGSILQISATAKPGHTAEELEKAIDDEVAKLAAEGPTEAEVEAARQSIYLANVSSLERNGWFIGIADRLNRYNYYVKTPDYFDKDLARYAAVTPQSVKRYVAQYLQKSSRAGRLRRAGREEARGQRSDAARADEPGRAPAARGHRDLAQHGAAAGGRAGARPAQADAFRPSERAHGLSRRGSSSPARDGRARLPVGERGRSRRPPGTRLVHRGHGRGGDRDVGRPRHREPPPCSRDELAQDLRHGPREPGRAVPHHERAGGPLAARRRDPPSDLPPGRPRPRPSGPARRPDPGEGLAARDRHARAPFVALWARPSLRAHEPRHRGGAEEDRA